MRYRDRVRYEPFLFVPSAEGTYKDIHGSPMKRKDFRNMREAQDFIDSYSSVDGFRWGGYSKWIYPFINEAYPGEISWDFSKLKIQVLDIEVLKNDKGKYASIEDADGKVSLIGIRYRSSRIILGWKEYLPSTAEYTYVPCKDEADMLERFICIWQDEDARPDIVTGWNIEAFDIPYLVNRIRIVLGDEAVKRLSPWGLMRKNRLINYGRETEVDFPMGLTILDYLDVYKKFTYHQLESYRLDFVSKYEVGKGKVDYQELGYNNLDDLFERNYQLYVEYNAGDLDRVMDIDAKNRFLELACTIAYSAKVNISESLTSVRLWEVICHNHLLNKHGVAFPTDLRQEDRPIAGGYVKDPRLGLIDWVVSFDLQSLYPHTIMWGNFSPETFRGMDEIDDSGRDAIIAGQKENITEFSQAGNGAYFSKEKMGFMPELMKLYFGRRKEAKDEMLKLKQTLKDVEAEIKKRKEG